MIHRVVARHESSAVETMRICKTLSIPSFLGPDEVLQDLRDAREGRYLAVTDPRIAKPAKPAVGVLRVCDLCGKLVGPEHLRNCGKCGKEVYECQLHRLSTGDSQGYYSPGTSVCPECYREIKRETSVMEDEDPLS